MTANIIYLTHGDERYLRQAKFSLLTLMHHLGSSRSDVQIHMYTDTPEYFARFPLNIRLAKKSEIKRWQGEYGFVHRAKIEVIREVFGGHDGHILFLDSDILVLDSLELLLGKLASGSSILWEYEKRITDHSDRQTRALHNILTKQSHFELNDRAYNIPLDQAMYNASVIGINDRNRHLANDALMLTDALLEHGQSHVVEQFAFSFLLDQAGPLAVASKFFYHWSGQGQAIDDMIEEFLAGHKDLPPNRLAELAASMSNELINAPRTPKPSFWARQKRSLGKLPLKWQRLKKKF